METVDAMTSVSPLQSPHARGAESPDARDGDGASTVVTSPRANRRVPRRRSKSTNSILGRMDENLNVMSGIVRDDADARSRRKVHFLDFLSVSNNGSISYGNENASPGAAEAAVEVQDMKRQLADAKSVVEGMTDALGRKDVAREELQRERDVMYAELAKLRDALEKSDMANAKLTEELRLAEEEAAAAKAEAENAEVERIEGRLADVMRGVDELSETLEFAVECASSDGTLTTNATITAGDATTKNNASATGEQELERLQKFAVELAEESDVALDAAVEAATVEIARLEKRLREERVEKKMLRDAFELTETKMAPIRNKTQRLIDNGTALAFEVGIVGDLLSRGLSVPHVQKRDQPKTDIATMLLHKHHLLSEATSAQSSLKRTTEKLMHDLHALIAVLEKHSAGVTEASVVRCIAVRLGGLFANVTTVDELVDVCGKLKVAARPDWDTANDENVDSRKDAEIQNLRMQVEASDLILKSALHAQACKFETVKEELEKHSEEIEQEALREMQHYEGIVSSLSTKLQRAEKRLQLIDGDDSTTARCAVGPPSIESLPEAGSLPSSRNCSVSSIGSDISVGTLRERLIMERKMRKRDAARNGEISEKRTATIAELLATIRKLHGVKAMSMSRTSSDASVDNATVTSVKSALQSARSEILNIKEALEENGM